MKSNAYVLDKNGIFITVSETNKIGTTTDLSEAARFTRQEADRFKNWATKKTKGFIVRKVIGAEQSGQEVEKTGSAPEMQEKTKRRAVSNSLKARVYNQSKGRCGICGRFVPCDNFTVDHVIPISKGGTYDINNLQAACPECNRMKCDFLPDDMLDRITEILRYQAFGKGDERAAKMIRKMNKEVKRNKRPSAKW